MRTRWSGTDERVVIGLIGAQDTFNLEPDEAHPDYAGLDQHELLAALRVALRDASHEDLVRISWMLGGRSAGPAKLTARFQTAPLPGDLLSEHREHLRVIEAGGAEEIEQGECDRPLVVLRLVKTRRDGLD